MRNQWYVRRYSKQRYCIEGDYSSANSNPRLSDMLEELEADGYRIEQLVDREDEVVVYAKRIVVNKRKRWCVDVFWNGMLTVGLFDTRAEAERFAGEIAPSCYVRGCWVSDEELPPPTDRFGELVVGGPAEDERWYVTPEEYHALRAQEKRT